ncbi:bifunctional acetaldehyde-CoA/alcohol dehydrogenase [Kiritimatiella glycovorans]|uniref:Aldehyde-alcohol dehydrogenase n=1 Tax=Kiritimatiella glycovorans TaxID=1307763 RepID=A0A0G3EH67_9BACT|nr:bifunctional acetaldehyde-CoA/alcohol dehydrogenase [Kiritimatiella glycovorans]AKJ65703.1 Aldehyde-alcohol dehydrogenase [Kiritimatiella glycovorans]
MTDEAKKVLQEMVDRVRTAQERYAVFDQEAVDGIFRHAALAANRERIRLARMAAEETGMGIVEDKVIKNHFASEFIYNKYKDTQTCGVLEEDPSFGIRRIAEPIGVIAGVVPTTNPTSTAIFKALLALKTRNGIIFSPHPRAKACTAEAARVVGRAAVEAGAPEGLIACIEEPAVELSNALMKHPDIRLVLATGGPGMVRAAYSSGKPALGVGAGNTPAVIDETACVRTAVNSILLSKTFDHGVICASEQSAVAVDAVYGEVRDEFERRGAAILTPGQKEKVGAVLLKDGKLNAANVGQPAAKIAAAAGIEVPPETKVLVAEVDEVGEHEPFAFEKLSPVLALYRAPAFDRAVDRAVELVTFGGIGHTSVLYTDPRNTERIDRFGARMKTGRVLVNMPSSQGAIGDIYNFKLEPSLTLGCGSWGGNSVSENVGVKHLMNIKTVAERRENMLWFRVPPKVYFKYGCLPVAMGELAGRKRALIVTDKPLYDLGFADRIATVLDGMGIDHQTFYDVRPDPDLATVRAGLKVMTTFRPDVVIALGGGSPMDAAKIMWLMYENPGMKFEDMAMRFMDIRKRIYAFPETGRRAILVAVPTTSGTGSEVTPFAVVTDDATGAKYPIADYALTPDMAIVDPELVMHMPANLTAYGGVDALTHALEAIVSVLSTEFTNCQALEAVRLLFKYLPDAYEHGAADRKAREKVHYAATLAGMAFANAFLGVCHSMAHKLGAAFDLPHGLANALLIGEVIRYNATDRPLKQAAFPQYSWPTARERYARVADYLQLGGATPDEKVERLIAAVGDLKQRLDIPATIREAGVPEGAFRERLDELAEDAFDDQCTGANPRYPLIGELRRLYRRAYGK